MWNSKTRTVAYFKIVNYTATITVYYKLYRHQHRLLYSTDCQEKCPGGFGEGHTRTPVMHL